MVLADVRAVLHLALVADARPHHLGESVEVVALQAQPLLNLLSHLLRPGLGAEGTHAQLDLVAGDAHLVHRLGQVESVAGCAGDARHAEVADELQVLLGVARRCRHHAGADVLHAVVGSQSAGEQPVAVAHGERVVAGDAVGRQTAGHALAPHADVLAGVAYDGGVARGAAAGVDADDFALRGSLQAEGVVVAQVLLRGEGQLADILDGLYVVGADVQLLQLMAIEGHVVVDVLHDFVQAFALERAHLVAAHTFFVRVPDHSSFVLSCLSGRLFVIFCSAYFAAKVIKKVDMPCSLSLFLLKRKQIVASSMPRGINVCRKSG